jgi:hypothetical protein
MSIDGEWKIVVDSPMGAQEATATIAAAGDVLTGTAQSSLGAAELENGRIDGDRASWTMRISSPFPMELKYAAVFSGDTVSGTVDIGMFGKSPFKGRKV